MSCDLTKFPMPLVLASFKSHLWDFTQTFQIILLLNITKPGNISFHNGKFGKVTSVWKKNTRWYNTRCYKPTLSSISVSNCCNDKNKTKELLEGDTCRYEGGTSQGSHSRFQWVGICVARNICLLDCMGKHFDWMWGADVCTVHGYLGIGGTGVSGMRGFFHCYASCLNRQLLARWVTYNTVG